MQVVVLTAESARRVGDVAARLAKRAPRKRALIAIVIGGSSYYGSKVLAPIGGLTVIKNELTKRVREQV